MASSTKGSTRIPPGYLDWGVVHSISPDLGVLMHTACDDQHIYTASTKASKWEIRQWKTDSLLFALVASGENHLAMRCFEVIGQYLFVCFANGTLAVHSMDTQAPARKPFTAHAAEIKHITRGHGSTFITCCLDNQVRTWNASAEKIGSDVPLGPIATCNDASKQVNFILPVTSDDGERTVWTASMDGRLYIYKEDGAGGLSDVQVLAHESMRSGVRVLARLGNRIFAGAEDGHVSCWKEDSRTLVAASSVHSNIVSCMCAVGDLVWTGGHDNKVSALDAACAVRYQVGSRKENGEVSQQGGTKAIMLWGWNVWVFGTKSLTIYSAHALAQKVADQMHEKQRHTAKLLQQLEDSKRLVARKDADLVEAAGRLHSKEEQWEALATEQQEALGKCKKERDDALVQSRGLVEEGDRVKQELSDCKETLETLRRTIQELKAQQDASREASEALAAQLKAQLHDKALEAETTKASAEELEATNQRLQAEVDYATAARAAAESSIASHQQQIAMLEAALVEQRGKESKMEGDLRVAQGRVEELQAEVAALGGKEAQTSAESEKLKQDSLALQKQVDDAQQAIAEYREQAEQLAARLDAALGQAGNLEIERNSLEAELKERITELQATKDTVAANNEQLEQLKAAKAEADNSLAKAGLTESSMATNFERQLGSLQADMASKDAQIADLLTRLHELEALVKELQEAEEAAEKEVENGRRAAADLEQRLQDAAADAKGKEAALEALRGELSAAEASGRDLEKEAEALRRELEDVKAAAGVDTAERGRVESTLRGELEAARVDTAELRKGEGLLRAELEAAKAAVAKVSAELSAARQEVEASRDNATKEGQEVSRLRQELAASKGAAEEMGREAVRLRQELDAQAAVSASQSSELQRLRKAEEEAAELRAAVGNADAALRTLQQMQAQLEELETANVALRADAEARSAALGTLTKSAEGKDAEMAALASAHEELGNVAEELRAAKAAIQTELDALLADRERVQRELTDSLAEAHQQQANIQNAHAQLQGELQALQQRTSALSSAQQAEIDDLQAERDRHKAALFKAQEALRDLQHEHVELQSRSKTSVEERQELQTQLGESLAQTEALKLQHEKDMRRAEGLQMELAAAKRGAEELLKGQMRAEMETLRREHERLRDALAGAEQKCGMLGDVRAQANSLMAQLEAQMRDMRDQGRELERLRGRLGEAEALVVSLRERYSLCEKEVEAGTQKRYALEAAAIEMRTKMEQGRIVRQQLERELKKYVKPKANGNLSAIERERQQFEEERHAKAAEISQLHGRLAELRHQLETSRMKADQEARKHDEELAATNATLNELKLENADLEKDLRTARQQLDGAVTGAASDRMLEMQGALKQAVKDYDLLLQELGNVRNDSRKKSGVIDVLQARLSKAGEEQQSQQQEQEELERLLNELEARMNPPQPPSPPAAGLPSKYRRDLSSSPPRGEYEIELAKRARESMRTPEFSDNSTPSRTSAFGRATPPLPSDRDERPVMGGGVSGTGGETLRQSGSRTRERMRIIPPTGFC